MAKKGWTRQFRLIDRERENYVNCTWNFVTLKLLLMISDICSRQAIWVRGSQSENRFQAKIVGGWQTIHENQPNEPFARQCCSNYRKEITFWPAEWKREMFDLGIRGFFYSPPPHITTIASFTNNIKLLFRRQIFPPFAVFKISHLLSWFDTKYFSCFLLKDGVYGTFLNDVIMNVLENNIICM